MTHVQTIHLANAQLDIQLANRFFKRLRGLLLKAPLQPQQGLLITPCNSVHTFGMGYALDIVFLSETNHILKISHNCPPWRMVYCRKAKHTLELLAGESQRLSLQVGMQLPLSALEGTSP